MKSFYLSQDQTQIKRYVGTKSDHWGLSYGPANFVRMSARVARERIELNFKHAQLLSYWSDFASTYLIFSAWSLLKEKSSTLSVLSLTVWPEIDLNWLSVWVWEWCPSMLILFSFSLRAPLQLSQIWLCRSCELFWHALRISNWSEVSFWYP